MKEAAESSKDTTPGSTTTTTTTDVHSDDQLQGSTDDNSPSLLLLPSSAPTIISEVGCKFSLVKSKKFNLRNLKIPEIVHILYSFCPVVFTYT